MSYSKIIEEKFSAMREEAIAAVNANEDRRHIYAKVSKKYREVLSLVLDEQTKNNEAARARIMDILSGSKAHHRESDCPRCGCHTDHPVAVGPWIGKSREDYCPVCGAEFELSDPRSHVRKELHEWPSRRLYEELHHVHIAYENDPMTHDEAAGNREYFSALASALAMKGSSVHERPKDDVFDTRADIEKWQAEQLRRIKLRDHAAELIARIDGVEVQTYILSRGLPFETISDLESLIEQLELEAEVKKRLP